MRGGRSSAAASGVINRRIAAPSPGRSTAEMLPEARPRSRYHQSVAIRPLVLLVPSMAAAVELPRRLAATGAVAGLFPPKVLDLARAVAEPALLARALRAWDTG